MKQNEHNAAFITDEAEIPLSSDHVPKRGRLPDPDYIEETAQIPQRKRLARILVIDERNQLRNADLAQSNYEYLDNMAAASRQKEQYKMMVQARKNASFWVFGQGIGYVGVGLGVSRIEHPLSCFSGKELFHVIQGESSSEGRKRSHGSPEGSESDRKNKRVRRREDEEEIGRGEDFDFGDRGAYEVRAVTIFLYTLLSSIS